MISFAQPSPCLGRSFSAVVASVQVLFGRLEIHFGLVEFPLELIEIVTLRTTVRTSIQDLADLLQTQACFIDIFFGAFHLPAKANPVALTVSCWTWNRSGE